MRRLALLVALLALAPTMTTHAVAFADERVVVEELGGSGEDASGYTEPGDLVRDLDGSTEATQPQAAPPDPPPNPNCPGDAPRSRLTEVGYLTAAAHRCHVALKESSALTDAIEVAISLGDYGDGAEARVLFNDARQRGFSEGQSQADCAKVAASIRDYSRELLRDQ